jgi:hypothetical protein
VQLINKNPTTRTGSGSNNADSKSRSTASTTTSKPSSASKVPTTASATPTPTTTAATTSTHAEDEENWKNHIEPLISLMKMCLKGEKLIWMNSDLKFIKIETPPIIDNQMDQFCENCDKLNKLLEQFQMYTKATSKRSIILKQVFRYLDTDCDRVKIRASKIILNVRITQIKKNKLNYLNFLILNRNSIYKKDESRWKQFDEYFSIALFNQSKHRERRLFHGERDYRLVAELV